MGLFWKGCLHVISNSVSIPNRPECLSNLIQTAKHTEFSPSVTRLLVQDNIKKKNRRQNQWGKKKKKTFQLSIPFLYCLSNSKVTCFQIGLKLNPKFQINQFLSEISYHTQKNYLNYLVILTHLSSLFSSLVYSPPFLLLSSAFGERNAKNKHKGMCRSVTSLPI